MSFEIHRLVLFSPYVSLLYWFVSLFNLSVALNLHIWWLKVKSKIIVSSIFTILVSLFRFLPSYFRVFVVSSYDWVAMAFTEHRSCLLTALTAHNIHTLNSRNVWTIVKKCTHLVYLYLTPEIIYINCKWKETKKWLTKNTKLCKILISFIEEIHIKSC
jgi:hypothetical protein